VRKPWRRTMAAQEFISSCEAEVEPAGFLLALLGDQKGTAGSFGSQHALPEGIAMWVGPVQEGELPRGSSHSTTRYVARA
jgi:hypothetical protein